MNDFGANFEWEEIGHTQASSDWVSPVMRTVNHYQQQTRRISHIQAWHLQLGQAHRRLNKPGCVSHGDSMWSSGGPAYLLLFQSQPVSDPSSDTRKSFDCLPLSLPSNPNLLQEPCGGTGHKAAAGPFTGRIFSHQPCFFALTAKWAYRRLFLLNASLMASSQGTVSSTMKTRWHELDQRTRS